MLKKVLLLMCLSIFAFSASKAQTDKEARQVLDKTAAIVGNKGGAQASFKLSNGKLGAINGTISIKGNKFYARSAKATVWFNGKTQWSYREFSFVLGYYRIGMGDISTDSRSTVVQMLFFLRSIYL